MTPMGRIPKLAKKEPERKETSSTLRSSEGSKERPKSTSSHSKPDSKSKSKHDDRHAHRLPSSSDKVDDRKRDKHKKKKKEKDKEREKEDKLKKQDKSKSRSHSTDDERHHKKLKKSKDSKKKDDKDRLPSKDKDKKDKLKREEKEKERAREKNMSKEDREKEKAKRRHKEMVEEQRKMFEQLRKKKKLENGNGDSDGDDSSGDEANFSIFDELVFDENNPIYFSMYDKVKARRSCVKAKEEEEARRQEEALNKFAKLKAQRAKREGKKKSVDSDDDSLDEDEIGHPRNSSPLNSDDGTGGSLNKKNSSLLNSSSDSEDDLNGQVKREPGKVKSGNASNDERKRSFKPKPRALDSSDEESPSGSRKPRGKLHPGLDSSESEELAEDEKKSESKPLRKLPIYSDSDSENDSVKNSHTKLSGSESEVTDSKASALAVLAMNKKKLDIKQEVKNEPVSSDGETEPNEPVANADFASVKKEIKLEDGAEQKVHKKKAHHVKKEKKRERENKEVGKEKSLLGQKLKMAKIFGTSSEDEGNSRNSKPPTPNTSGGKTSAAKSMSKTTSRSHISRMEVVNFSDTSDAEKRQESLALMSDSDDDVPSRPPTPTFPAAKTGAKPQEQTKAKEQVEVKEVVQNDDVQKINKDEGKLTNESSEDELLPKEAKYDTKNEQERNRRLSAHDRQKESENLFDSLLTVNVDLPAKSTSWKSPGGSLKSPNVKSPNKVSPGVAKTQSSGSPGSHRSPLVSPGGKPTYLLAHMFGAGDRSAREAEKIHRAQEREMHKKGSDRISKETFKTKKDLDDASSTKKQDEGRSEIAAGEKMVTEEKEKNVVETKEKEPVQEAEQGKKKSSEAKLKEKILPSSVSPKEVEVEKEVKAKISESAKTKEDGKPKEKKTRPAEDGFGDRKSGRDRTKEEKKLLDVIDPKVKTGTARTSAIGKEKDEEHHARAAKKLEGGLGPTRPEVTETQPKLAKSEGTNALNRGTFTQEAPSTKDSVFDFKDEVEVVGTLKPASSLESLKSKFSKGCEKPPPVIVDVSATPPASPTATLPSSSSYASFAASTKIEATSSPGPASEDDDTPLLIIADDSEVTEVSPDIEEVKEVKQKVNESKSLVTEVENEEAAEATGTAVVPAKSTAGSNAKQLKSSESSEQEQLEKSIASITGDARRNTVDSMDTETAALTTTVEQKRTVISQEETENATNALLGESFESFEPEPEPVEPEPAGAAGGGVEQTTREDDEAAAAVAGLADADEAASAVLGLAEAGDWHTNVSKQQEDESIENIAAEIRRSSTESLRRFSTESSKSGEEPNKSEEKPVHKAPETKKAEEAEKPSKSQTEETSANLEIPATPSKPKSVESKEKKQAEDVFDFKVDEEPSEPLKTVDRQKQAAAVEPLDEVAKTEETPVVPAKVGTARESTRSKAQPIQSSQVVQQPQHVQTTTSSLVSATVTSPSSAVGRESPLVLQRLSTEEKSSTPLPLASPNLPLASPNSVKSPKPRTRRSTGGKSRESEEESPDTLQKVNLILEQAKQEAERSQAHQSQAQVQHQLVSPPAAL